MPEKRLKGNKWVMDVVFGPVGYGVSGHGVLCGQILCQIMVTHNLIP